MSAGVVLLNPVSGASRGTNDVESLTRWAQEYGSRLRCSERAGHLTEMAREEVKAGTRLIVVAGGDDTVREGLLGLDQAGVFDMPVEQRPAFGIVPLGTFNNFARYLGLPAEAELALREAHTGEMRFVDLGRAHGHLFTESVGVGLDVEAWEAFPKESPSVFRRLWDGALAVVKALTRFRPRRYRLLVDGRPSLVRAYSITVANCSLFSAAVTIAPHAVVDDGQLDLCVLPAVSRLRFILNLPLVFLGKHTQVKGVRYEQVRQVRIEGSVPAQVRIDGKLKGWLPVDIEVMSRALPMRLPKPAVAPQEVVDHPAAQV